MRSSRVVRASDCQCRSCNSPGFDPASSDTVQNLRGRKMKQCWIKCKKILKNSPITVVCSLANTQLRSHLNILPQLKHSKSHTSISSLPHVRAAWTKEEPEMSESTHILNIFYNDYFLQWPKHKFRLFAFSTFSANNYSLKPPKIGGTISFFCPFKTWFF
jgi:hypothetical protein